MTLIKSISGIRGTIGGLAGEGLSPIDVVKFTAAYGTFIKQQYNIKKGKIIVGRDARISGEMIESLVANTLSSIGLDVVNLGLATTPTVEIAVTEEKAQGGIIITASHNPRQWNALKLLNAKGEFLSANDGTKLMEIAESNEVNFSSVDDIGKITHIDNYETIHIKKILNLPYIDLKAIQQANFTVAIDCVNSVGGIAIPALLKSLGVKNIIELYCTPNGEFPHNPEPLPEHLSEISAVVKSRKAHLGIVVDPDVDRLAIINEDGSMFGEEYTLIAVADFILKQNKGNTVSNLSSSRALRDVTEAFGCTYTASAVGEVNVVEKMKATNAVIGGEGNGGVILPDLHYGRDALVGIALFLTHLAKSNMKCSELKKTYPNYCISKNKIELKPNVDVDGILKTIESIYSRQNVNTIDGVKIDFEKNKEWVHLRKSNTEPIIRVYSESQDEEKAARLSQEIISEIKKLL